MSIFDESRNEYLFNQRISWAKKKANGFKWAEDSCDFIDDVYNCYGDKERMTRLKMNYDLFNGQGESAMGMYGTDHQGFLAEEGLDMDYSAVQHHNVIDQIAKAMHGEQELRPFNPMAFDTSRYTLNSRKRKKLELAQEYLAQNIIDPIKQQVTNQYMQENEIKDMYALSPEEQQQMQADITGRTDAMTPQEIKSYMRKDYKSPEEIQAQKLMDFLVQDLDLKYVTDEGFKHAIITGEEVYRTGIRHNRAFCELVDPMGFFHIGRPNSMFVEDGVAWKYEQYVMFNDIYNWHGEEIGNNRYKKEKLDSYASGIIDSGWGASNPGLVAEVSRGNTMIVDNSPDIRHKEGQDYMNNVLQGLSSTRNKGGDIRYLHTAWKGLRKLKQIKRYNSELDKVKSMWIDESYSFNEKKDGSGWQDIEENIAWVPEIWETTKVGYTDAVYFDKKPVEYQYRSLENPWDVKGPYIGAQYSKLMNNTKNVSPIDLGKPWQYKFNVQMAKIHETEATDIGKILLTSFHAKPKDWSWKKYLMMAKYGKIIPVDLQKEGVTPMDAQVMKQIDLSAVDRLAGQLQYLDFIRDQIASSMSYNPSRLGSQGSSVSVTNNQQNIVQSSYQTNNLYNVHNKVLENLCNSLINTTRVAFKDTETLKAFIMDDMSLAELELDHEMLNRSELQIKMRNSSEDFQNIIQLKQLMQPMVQNGLISFPELVKMQWAKSGAEIQNIAEEADEKMMQRQQKQQEEQQAMLEQQNAMAEQLAQQQQEFEMMKLQMQIAADKEQSIIESTRFAQQKDIDGNKVNDDLQKSMNEHDAKLIQMQLDHKHKLIELGFKERDSKDKMKLEETKLSKEIKLKEKELELKKQDLALKRQQKASSSSTSKPSK